MVDCYKLGEQLMLALDYIAELYPEDFDYYDFCTIVLKMHDNEALEFLDKYGSDGNGDC